jgi:hypothetical protein
MQTSSQAVRNVGIETIMIDLLRRTNKAPTTILLPNSELIVHLFHIPTSNMIDYLKRSVITMKLADCGTEGYFIYNHFI